MIRVIEPPKSNVKDVLEKLVERSDEFGTIVVLTMGKTGDSAPMIFTSAINQVEKCFLLQFFQSWVNHWFQPEKIGPK